MKVVRYAKVLLFVLVLGLTVVSCGKITLAAAAQEVNQTCPINAGEGLTISSVEYSDEGNLVYNVAVDENLIDINAIQENADQIRDAFAEDFKKNTDLYNLCKEANAKVVYSLRGSNSGTGLDVTLTVE